MITSASFETLAEPPIPAWIIRMTAVGTDLTDTALKLAARVGDVPVEGLLIDDDGNGFTGYLTAAPIDGDRLFVGYDPSLLEDTGVTYSAPNV
jgi:hypothetical protein